MIDENTQSSIWNDLIHNKETSTKFKPELRYPLEGIRIRDFLVDHVEHDVSGVHLYDDQSWEYLSLPGSQLASHQITQIIQLCKNYMKLLVDRNIELRTSRLDVTSYYSMFLFIIMFKLN